MEEDIKIIEELIKQNEGAVKEAKSSNDINSMNLIADMDSQNKALEHLLQAYKEDKAVIEEMAIQLSTSDEDKEKMKEYFRNKVKGEKE